MQTAYDLVRLAAQRAPDHPALVDDRTDRALTYTQLVAEIDCVAAGLAAQGLRAGQLVATCLPNSFDHALALLALARLGAVAALINARLKSEEVGQLIAQGKMAGAIVAADQNFVAAARTALPPGSPLITLGGMLPGTVAFADCRADPAALQAPGNPDPEATAYVFYTSGTTGLPKGVEIPYRATDSRVLYLSVQCGLVHGRHNRILGLMPLFHAVGFYSGLLGALGLDGTYYVCSAFDPPAAVEAIEKLGITLVYATPTHFHALLAAPGFSRAKMASVQHVIYAGSGMPGPLLDRVGEAFDARIVNIYGTTEIMNALYMPDPVGRPHTYRPGFYANVRVGRFGGSVHDTAAVGEDGELLSDASADATFTRYLHRPDATQERLQDGWYRTGDIAVRRADGDLDLKGRVDDMIISGGENIYPEEVEAALIGFEGVRECSVVGAPHEKWGEIVVAFIVTAEGAVTEMQLDSHMRAGRLPDYKRPRLYLFVPELPKNAANKVLRRMLRGKAAEEAAARRPA